LIATIRKTKHVDADLPVKMEMTEKDRRAYNLINRGNRIMEARLKKSSVVGD
jgi:hypothetical protein